MKEYIYKDITELNTPAGHFSVTDGNINIPFSVRKNTFDVPADVYDKNGKIIDKITTETNYALVIDAKKLKIGSCYHIEFSNGVFAYGAGDEHTESRIATVDGWSVGIGSYNPNDEDETKQILANKDECRLFCEEFDETNFIKYVLYSSMRGFKFKLLDYSMPEIVFYIAWIKNEVYGKDIYEDALDFWLT